MPIIRRWKCTRDAAGGNRRKRKRKNNRRLIRSRKRKKGKKEEGGEEEGEGEEANTCFPDGHARIWSTEAISNAGNPDYTKPRQLAAMSHHSGTVHSVRFSGNGKYLASGGDDKIVCIYNLDPSPPTHTTFGT